MSREGIRTAGARRRDSFIVEHNGVTLNQRRGRGRRQLPRASAAACHVKVGVITDGIETSPGESLPSFVSGAPTSNPTEW